MHRHALDEGFGEERAGNGDCANQKRKGQYLHRDDTGQAEDEILMTPVTTEITASVAITAAPSSPDAINSDSRITPEPDVPPTTTP